MNSWERAAGDSPVMTTVLFFIDMVLMGMAAPVCCWIDFCMISRNKSSAVYLFCIFLKNWPMVSMWRLAIGSLA